jgi:hypothetical protein
MRLTAKKSLAVGKSGMSGLRTGQHAVMECNPDLTIIRLSKCSMRISTKKGDKNMSNMSYCRFENTYYDLVDCYEHIHEGEDEMSEYEKSAKAKLIKLCRKIAENFSDEEMEN